MDICVIMLHYLPLYLRVWSNTPLKPPPAVNNGTLCASVLRPLWRLHVCVYVCMCVYMHMYVLQLSAVCSSSSQRPKHSGRLLPELTAAAFTRLQLAAAMFLFHTMSILLKQYMLKTKISECNMGGCAENNFLHRTLKCKYLNHERLTFMLNIV